MKKFLHNGLAATLFFAMVSGLGTASADSQHIPRTNSSNLYFPNFHAPEIGPQSEKEVLDTVTVKMTGEVSGEWIYGSLDKMNDVIHSLWLCDERLTDGRAQTWGQILYLGKLGNPVFHIDGRDSGVVVDEGSRDLFTVTLSSCFNRTTKYTIRYTFDKSVKGACAERNPTTDRLIGPICGYEVFIRRDAADGSKYYHCDETSIDLVTCGGFAAVEDHFFNSLLDIVPGLDVLFRPLPIGEALAFDKDGNKSPVTYYRNGLVNVSVFGGKGCMSCHTHVSFDYGMPGAAEFWNSN